MRGVTAVIAVLMMYASLAAVKVTLTLRNGQNVTGTIVRMDDTNIVLQTAAGQRTYPWRMLSNESIKQANPELYQRLLARAHERQQLHAPAAQQTNAFPQPAPQPAHASITPAAPSSALLTSVRIGVDTATRKGKQLKSSPEGKKEVRKLGWNYEITRPCWGELTVRLEGLNPAHVYRVRTQTQLHLQRIRSGDFKGTTKRGNTSVHGAGVQNITNATTARLVFPTAHYIEREYVDGGLSGLTTYRAR